VEEKASCARASSRNQQQWALERDVAHYTQMVGAPRGFAARSIGLGDGFPDLPLCASGNVVGQRASDLNFRLVGRPETAQRAEKAVKEGVVAN
jgi:hypothetical protein